MKDVSKQFFYIYIAAWRPKTQRRLEDREVNQARSKTYTVDRPVRTARTFMHHYNCTQYCSTETVLLIFPFLQTSVSLCKWRATSYVWLPEWWVIGRQADQSAALLRCTWRFAAADWSSCPQQTCLSQASVMTQNGWPDLLSTPALISASSATCLSNTIDHHTVTTTDNIKTHKADCHKTATADYHL